MGYTASEVLDKPCAELMEGQGELGTLVCRDQCNVLECVAAHCEVPNFDLEVKTRSGQRIWVNVSIIEFHDIRTKRHLAIHLMRDIRKKKKTEDLTQKLLDAAGALVSVSKGAEPSAPVTPLTGQEQKLLKLLAAGKSPGQVARQLKITDRTLRNHLYHVNRKLRTRNRLEAVIHATRRGLI